MANTLAPFGFSWVGATDGRPPNFGSFNAKIASTNGTSIFKGDVVKQLSTGYIDKAAAGYADATHPILGVFWGCRYYNTAAKIPTFSPYWPGSGATGDVDAFIVTDPLALFLVQCGGLSGSALPFTAVGKNADIDTTTAGNTSNGISGMALDDNLVGTTSTYPFKIIERFSQQVNPAGQPALQIQGADDTTKYNWCYVTFNNQVLKSAGTTGI